VYCQVVYICGCIPARIRHALADLPETLDETYQRNLREINKADWEFAHRLFQFVSVASRPLRVKELAELLAFDFEARPIPKYQEAWRLEDPVDAVLSKCSSLLAIVDGVNIHIGKVIQFSHFSVKEFLTSARLAEASDIVPRRYHISMTPAHTLAAQVCLGILFHQEKDAVSNGNLGELSLARYAARHFADHARFEGVSRNIEDGLKQLFDPSRPHLAVYAWIDAPGAYWGEISPTGRPSRPHGSPLHYAAHWGLHSMVEFLVIEHAQDVHSQSFPYNAAPLHLASERGHVKVVRFLLERDADVTAQNGRGCTPLHLASSKGQREVADMLIEHGADVMAQDKYGLTALHLASQEGQAEIAGMLIERGADVAAQTTNGYTPLQLTSQAGQVEAAEMLIEHGADVTARNKFGRTLLHEASINGYVEFTGMLIKRGVDVTAQDQNGSTPLHEASETGRLEVADMLIEHGADVTAQDKDGSTPLHLATQHGRAEVVGMLVERGADMAAQNKYGSTPLHLASQHGRAEIARILIERGADAITQNKDGSTPLHLASAQFHRHKTFARPFAAIVRMLLEHGADATIRDKDGRTPFDLASSGRSFKAVEHIFLKHGLEADPGTHENTN
jgi:ankyrin repeat protein